MNTATDTPFPTIGTPMEGGFFAGLINVDGTRFGLIVAPKFDGEHEDAAWSHSYKRISAAQSYCDGMANTEAMAASGSDLAKWARGLRIAGLDDWYLPSQDELEICYRAFKPCEDTNSLYGRSGLNISALPPTYPYYSTTPAETSLEAFREGGSEAFDCVWYWSSTQHADDDVCVWCQYFDNGDQNYDLKYYRLRARAVRRVAI